MPLLPLKPLGYFYEPPGVSKLQRRAHALPSLGPWR